jgi:hypothetical protein
MSGLSRDLLVPRDLDAPAGDVADRGDRVASLRPVLRVPVVAGSERVGERQGRRHQRVVLTHREHDDRPVCLRGAHRLTPSQSRLPPVQPP